MLAGPARRRWPARPVAAERLEAVARAHRAILVVGRGRLRRAPVALLFRSGRRRRLPVVLLVGISGRCCCRRRRRRVRRIARLGCFRNFRRSWRFPRALLGDVSAAIVVLLAVRAGSDSSARIASGSGQRHFRIGRFRLRFLPFCLHSKATNKAIT